MATSSNLTLDGMNTSHSEILNAHTEKLDLHKEMIGGQMEDTSEVKAELKEKVDRTEFIELKQAVLAMS